MQTNSLIALHERVAQLEALCASQQKSLGDISSKLSQLTDLMRPIVAHRAPNADHAHPPVACVPPAEPKRLPPFSLVISTIAEGFTNTDLAPFTIYTRDAHDGALWSKQVVEVALRLLDAQGVGVSGMTTPASTVRLADGKATVEGIRIETVSSKHGGAYKIEAKVTGPEEIVAEGIPVATSNPFVVWHERVKNNGKKGLEELRAQDNLSQFPRIGRVYVDRFRDLGVHTVANLAALPLSREDRQKCDQVLQCVRKDKGILTAARLDAYIRQARDVVARSAGHKSGAAHHPEHPEQSAQAGQGEHEQEHPAATLPSPPCLESALEDELMALSKPGDKLVWEEEMELHNPTHQELGFPALVCSPPQQAQQQQPGEDSEGGVDGYLNQNHISSPNVDSWFA